MSQSLNIIKHKSDELPNNIEAEQSVIGSILLANEIFDEVSLIIRRSNGTKLVRVVLRNENGNTTLTDRKEIEKQNVIFGATFKDISDEYNLININHGVIVEDLKEGKLKDAGLKKGFIITHIDKYPIKSKKQLLNLLKTKKGGILIEGKFENGVKGYFGFGL